MWVFGFPPCLSSMTYYDLLDREITLGDFLYGITRTVLHQEFGTLYTHSLFYKGHCKIENSIVPCVSLISIYIFSHFTMIY